MGDLILPDCWSDERRMKVLFSPLRKNRAVNPENYDSQIKFWKDLIAKNFAKRPQFTLEDLRRTFTRNGEQPHCLKEVLAEMEAGGEIKSREQFLQDSSWSSWFRKPLDLGMKMIRDNLLGEGSKGPPVFVLLDAINAQADDLLHSLRNQIVTLAEVKSRLSEWEIAKESLPLVLHELQCRQRIVKMTIDTGDVQTSSDDERVAIKFGTELHKAFPFTEIELAIQKLETTERVLEKRIKVLETEIQTHEDSAKKLLAEKKRNLAKNALRKRDATTKRLEKRMKCLENVQELMDRIHQVSEDAQVLDAYRTGTKSLQVALKKSGITLDTVDEAIAEMQDVLEVHEEIRGALSPEFSRDTPEDDAELEKELNELVKEDEENGEDKIVKELEKLNILSDPLETKTNDKSKESSGKEAVCV